MCRLYCVRCAVFWFSLSGKLVETNFTAALGAVQRGEVALGRSHAGAVAAALGSAGAYADWAPVTALGSSKLVEA